MANKTANKQDYPGIILSVSAPSGTGKTSLVNALLARHQDVHISISHTTRPIRPNEEAGKHYHFVSREDFEDLIKTDNFLEHAHVFDHLYGTSVESVLSPMSQGKDVLLDIDWQGAASAKRLFPKNAVSVFLLPPSREVLETRLRGRGQDSEEVIARRISAADEELLHSLEYDYVIVNDSFDHALQELESILLAERCRWRRQNFRHSEVFKKLGLSALGL
jgi:guanylate kinase